MPCVLKILVPEALASAVIGKGGQVIKAMRESTQSKLGLSDHNDFYPGTDCRILTAQANNPESLGEVCVQVIQKLSEATPDPAAPSGELKLRVLMPRAAVGGLIGKGGSNIKSLREQSGARINIAEAGSPGPAAEQLVTLMGSQPALELVMQEVNKQIQALQEEAWFSSWAQAGTGAGGGGYDGYGGGYSSSGYGSSGGGGGGGGGGKGSRNGSGYQGSSYHPPGVDLLVQVAGGLPSYVLDDVRGFALSCVVPNRLVGGIIGRAGAGTKEVQSLTGTKIGIREIPGDPENRSLNIAGPLPNTCAAYMLMMKRYLDSEAQANTSQGGRDW